MLVLCIIFFSFSFLLDQIELIKCKSFSIFGFVLLLPWVVVESYWTINGGESVRAGALINMRNRDIYMISSDSV